MLDLERPLRIYLIVATDIKKYYRIIKLGINNSNITCHRKGSFAGKLTRQCMVM